MTHSCRNPAVSVATPPGTFVQHGGSGLQGGGRGSPVRGGGLYRRLRGVSIGLPAKGGASGVQGAGGSGVRALRWGERELCVGPCGRGSGLKKRCDRTDRFESFECTSARAVWGSSSNTHYCEWPPVAQDSGSQMGVLLFFVVET